jgi:hypothetical protein
MGDYGMNLAAHLQLRKYPAQLIHRPLNRLYGIATLLDILI